MSFHDYSQAPAPPRPPPANASPHGQPISPGRAAAVRPGIITQGTAFAHAHGHLHTPASATSLSPFSPFAHTTPSPYAPSPAASSPMAAPYNPQQWRGSGRPGVQYAPQTHMSINPVRAQDLSGHEEAMPSPPPPYTPAQSQNISQALSSSPGHAYPQGHPPPPPIPQSGTPSSARAARSFHSRPVSIAIPSGSTPIATANPQFAPPPVAGRDRSSSRGLSTKFSLSNFRSRNADHSPAPSAIESLHMSTNDVLQRGDPGPASQRNFTQYTPSPVDRRWVDTQSPVRPPNARRAASAGVLAHGTETRTPIDETPPNVQSNWGPGMPLPPPPPGPPPSSSRSQSVGPGYESERNSGYPAAPPTRRPGQTP